MRQQRRRKGYIFIRQALDARVPLVRFLRRQGKTWAEVADYLARRHGIRGREDEGPVSADWLRRWAKEMKI